MATTFHAPKYEIDRSLYLCHKCEGEIPCETAYYSAVFFGAESFVRRDFCPDCWERNRVQLARLNSAEEDPNAAGSAAESGPANPPNDGAPDTREAGGGASQAPNQNNDGEEAVPSDVASEDAQDAISEDAPAYAFWRSRRPPKPTDKPKRVRFDVELVFTFFQRLGNRDDMPSDKVRAESAELRFVFTLMLIRKKVLDLVSTAEHEGQEWLKVAEKRVPENTYWIRNPRLDGPQLERVKDRIGELLQMEV